MILRILIYVFGFIVYTMVFMRLVNERREQQQLESHARDEAAYIRLKFLVVAFGLGYIIFVWMVLNDLIKYVG